MIQPVSLRRFFSLQMLMVSALPLIVTVLLIYLFLLPLVKQNIAIQHHSLARAIAGLAFSHLMGGERQLLSIAEMLKERNRFSDKQITMILDSACGNEALFESIFIAEEDSQVITHVGLAASRRMLRNDLLGLDVSGRSYEETIKASKPAWSETFLSTLSSRMAVAITVHLPGQVIVGEITLNNLSDFIGNLPIETDLRTMILDRDGRIVADSGLAGMGRQLELKALPASKNANPPSSERYRMDGVELIGAMVDIDQLGWKVLVSQPYYTALGPVRTILLIFGVGLVFAFVTAMVFALKQATEKSKLVGFYVNQAKAIASGNYDLHWPPERIIEYNELGKRLQAMAMQIKERELNLIASENYMSIMLNSIGDGVIATNVAGMITRLNPTAEKLTGWRQAEAFGQKITDIFNIINNVTQEHAENPVEKVLATGQVIGLANHTVLISKDGSRYHIADSGAPIRDNDGDIVGVILVFRDVTEREQARQEQERLEAQLLQVQKLEAIGRLAGGIAHDLNNLLTPILGYGDLLSLDENIKGDSKYRLAQITKAAANAKDMVTQLLAFSRKQVLEYQPLDINEVVEKFESFIRHSIKENIDIRLYRSADIEPVMADPGQIEQVLMNLVINSSDAMPEGGKLSIETSMVDLDETYTKTHPEVVPGKYVMLAISDNGAGMDEVTLANIFEPFFSTKGDQGTGLGLATVYGIIKQHNGGIWVYSEPGHGTTIKITLPVVEQVTGSSKPRQDIPRDTSGTETILLVEDNDAVRETVHDILCQQGYQVITASDGRSALETISSGTDLDMLLTDVVMPDMNGKELYSLVCEKYPAIKVLYMSGYTDNIIVHHGVLEEGVQYIQKPFNALAIASKVREVLEG